MSRITRGMLALLLAALLAPAGAAAAPGFVRIGEFDEPIHVAAPPNDRERLFVVQRRGIIRVVRNDIPLAAPFLDLTGEAAPWKAGAGCSRSPSRRTTSGPASSTST
jgi:hypothetical protein